MHRMLLVIAATLAACGPKAAPPLPAAKPFAMRGYIFVMLKRGPTWTAEDTPEARRLGEGHMANIKAMGKAGKLVLAGPFDVDAAKADAIAGIFIFDATTPAEVEPLLANDPAIAAGRFVPEVFTWYGPAGLTYDGKGAEP
jgi:hypothetical protein